MVQSSLQKLDSGVTLVLCATGRRGTEVSVAGGQCFSGNSIAEKAAINQVRHDQALRQVCNLGGKKAQMWEKEGKCESIWQEMSPEGNITLSGHHSQATTDAGQE